MLILAEMLWDDQHIQAATSSFSRNATEFSSHPDS
jgi:hypothetical protein